MSDQDDAHAHALLDAVGIGPEGSGHLTTLQASLRREATDAGVGVEALDTPNARDATLVDRVMAQASIDMGATGATPKSELLAWIKRRERLDSIVDALVDYNAGNPT